MDDIYVFTLAGRNGYVEEQGLINYMKILSIAPQPFFSPRGTPFSVYYRTMVKAEFGHKIDLLTYGQGQDVDIPGVNIIRIPAFKALGAIKIGPSGLKLFLDVFIMMWTIALLMRKRYDLVHAHEEAIFMCLVLKPLFRFKLIYDMHSSLPQQLTNFKFSTSPLLIKTFEVLEKWSIESADSVITICPDLADYVDTVIDDKSKHVMIENSIIDSVKAIDSGPSRGLQVSGLIDEDTIFVWLKKRMLVAYAGTLESYQGIDILVDAFSLVVAQEPNARLLIMGGAEDQVHLYGQRAVLNGIEHAVMFTGRVPQQIAQKYTRLARVQVSPRSAGTNTPLKIYEQLANGVPLVATNIYSHTQAIDSTVAFLVNPTASAMSVGIIEALQSEDKRMRKVKAALSLYKTEYDKPVYKKKLHRVLNRATCTL